MPKKCPLCSKEYPSIAKVCPLKHCPNCGSTRLSAANIDLVTEVLRKAFSFIMLIVAGYMVSSLSSLLKEDFLVNALKLAKVALYIAVVVYVFHIAGWLFKVSRGAFSKYICLDCKYVFKEPKVNVSLVETEEKEETKVYSEEDTKVYD